MKDEVCNEVVYTYKVVYMIVFLKIMFCTKLSSCSTIHGPYKSRMNDMLATCCLVFGGRPDPKPHAHNRAAAVRLSLTGSRVAPDQRWVHKDFENLTQLEPIPKCKGQVPPFQNLIVTKKSDPSDPVKFHKIR
jgi:hypothetical protein